RRNRMVRVEQAKCKVVDGWMAAEIGGNGKVRKSTAWYRKLNQVPRLLVRESINGLVTVSDCNSGQSQRFQLQKELMLEIPTVLILVDIHSAITCYEVVLTCRGLLDHVASKHAHGL